ncbi:MAG: FMN-binding negative transcriptional regulator [Micropruina sp.]|uniref:FMN-binding negative transcriptional regulator n=1 Tax=Micropruina sp. TaxID=2737536 RepID=UPI0039E51C41
MYTPRHFTMPPELQARILAAPGVGDLITHGPSGLLATHLPYVFDPELGEHGSLVLHVARPNAQWREQTSGESLFIVTPATDYISSLWYPSAPASGKYIPTWDYVTLHIYGELIAHDDLDWTTMAAERLMGAHERTLGMDDMPADYVAGQLRAIVGLQLAITRIDAKAKLSQNRTPADVRGVIDGLREAGAEDSAGLVEEFGLPPAERRAALVADVAARHRPGPDSLAAGQVIGTPDPR